MSEDRQFLSEIERYGEQLCIIRDIFEHIPPKCDACGLLRFCESERSDDEIDRMVERIRHNGYRRQFFGIMEEDGYYD